MDNIPYVIGLLKRQFNFDAEAADFGYESVSLERGELDPDLLPGYFDEVQTGKEVLVHFYSVAEYIVYIIADMEDTHWQLVGILKEGKLVYSKMFD